MIANFAAPENLPFAVALGLMVALGLVQTLSLLMGLGFFDFLDDILPDFGADLGADVVPDSLPEAGLDADLDAALEMNAEAAVDLDPEPGADVETGGLEHSVLGHILGWLNLGKVPFIVSLIAFLFLFSFVGFQLQGIVARLSGGHPLPAYAASPLAFAVALLPLKWVNALFARILPHDETMAVSERTFVGRTATITIGRCTHNRPAEAKLRGPLGRTHYVMVVADNEGDSFEQGDRVLVVDRREAVFSVIGVKNPNLEG